ncbi:MAG: hypothetical protein AMJ88_00795 [Anaerolineae bacterium SM23_ 63]|nr:MAG: hypothetical protein AMJ88_00795 [Anaerolineae bacterium SM23_ 63]
MSHPLDDLISLAERTYVRLEAEQLIEDCLMNANPEPMNRLLEELVMAGMDSLIVLREILSVIRSVKSTINQEGMEVQHDLRKTLSQFGIGWPRDPSGGTPESYWHIYHYGLYQEIKAHAPWLKMEDQLILEEICNEAGKRVTKIVRRLVLLKDLEETVMDWINGMIHEIAHSTNLYPWSRQAPFHH